MKYKQALLILVLSVVGAVFIVAVPNNTSQSASAIIIRCSNGNPAPDGDAANCPEPVTPPLPSGSCDPTKSIFGIPTWYKYLEAEVDVSGKCSPKLFSSGSNDVESGANNALPIGLAILEGLIRIAGLVAVGMVFLGAFKYITSRGNPDNAKGARSTIINALIGLVIVIISTGVINFIGNTLVK